MFRVVMVILMISTLSGRVVASEIRVAVASNFKPTIIAIAKRFQENSGHKVIFSFGSTGKLYAQIKNGAPFDVFLAADAKRPALLEEEGIAISASRFTYAVGKLVLWSPQQDYVDVNGKSLAREDFQYLAIANPKIAPYGEAAIQVLQARGLWTQIKSRLVRGENIGQAFLFVRSGSAELGFLAYPQIKQPGKSIGGSFWVVPQSLYKPINQQAVLIRDLKVARTFLSFVRSAESIEIIHSYGYGTQ